MSDAAIGDVPKEKVFMKISEISQKSTSGGVCYNKVADLQAFNGRPYLAKLCQGKVVTRSDDNFTRFFFVLFRNLVFLCKGSQARIYADLVRF